MNIFRYELKKIFIENKALYVIIGFVLIMSIFNINADRPYNIGLELEKETYTRLAEEHNLYGKINNEKQDTVMLLKSNCIEAQQSFDEYFVKLRRGDIDSAEFFEETKQYSKKTNDKLGIDQLLNQIDYVKVDPQSRYIMYANGWESLFAMGYEYIFIIFAIIMSALIFAGEIDDGMEGFIVTCNNGKRKTIVSKLTILLGIMAIFIVGINIIHYCYVAENYQLNYGNFPIQSMQSFANCQLNLSIIQGFMLLNLIKYLGICIIAITSAIIFVIMKNTITGTAVSMVVSFISFAIAQNVGFDFSTIALGMIIGLAYIIVIFTITILLWDRRLRLR